jgi:phage shock protein PspC (stress-responsive transcriptional regulator)
MTLNMSDASPDFKISRAGNVIHENLSLAQVAQGIASKSIQASDHYWTAGMADWALVSSRQWVVTPALAPTPAPVAAPKPVPDPVTAPVHGFAASPTATKPAPTIPPAQSRPAMPPAATPISPPRQPSAASLANPIEKGFSPYVTYYRSNDDRWVFGIFGGLAHRNGWPKPLLLLIRLLMLFTIFPGISYLGWGFTAMLLTPSLPTARVRSYYDLNNGLPSQDSTDFSRFVKILVVGLILVVIAVWFASRRF